MCAWMHTCIVIYTHPSIMMRLFEAFRTLLCMCNRVVYTRTYIRTYSVTYPTVMSDITHDKGCVSVWSKAVCCLLYASGV